jgi:hypothetical protein
VKHIKLSDYGCRTDNIFSSEYHNLEYIWFQETIGLSDIKISDYWNL